MWTEYSFPGDFEIIKKGKSDFFCLYLPPISYEVKRLKETVFYDKPSLFGLRVKFNMPNIFSANSTNITNVTSREGDTADVPSAVGFIIIIIINTITCPFTVLLNLLVLKAVKSTPRLRANSNILLACLAVTDALTGLLGQPLFVLWKIFLFFGLSDSGTVEGCYHNYKCDYNGFILSFDVSYSREAHCGQKDEESSVGSLDPCFYQWGF